MTFFQIILVLASLKLAFLAGLLLGGQGKDRRTRIAHEASRMTRALGSGRYWTCPTCELPVPLADPGQGEDEGEEAVR